MNQKCFVNPLRSSTWMITLVSAAAMSATNAHALPSVVEVVNINKASSDQLQQLPRVGSKTAKRILARRAKRPFRRIAELMRIKGIGPKIFRTLRPYVTIVGPTTLKRKIKIKSNNKR